MIDTIVDTRQLLGEARYQNPSQAVTKQIANMPIPSLEGCLPIEQKRWQEFWQIFQAMYDTPNQPIENNPNERAINAFFKARRIEEIARERAGDNVSVEILTAKDPITNTETHNVVVTYGDSSTGPTVIYMVHHDTIVRADVPLSTYDENGITYIQGPAVQDDTLPLAAALTGLDQINKPEHGAIMVVFTDHEENGCRGSSGLLDDLKRRISPNHPVALFAAESTDGELATGHKGKFSAEVHFSQDTSVLPTDSFLYFYQNLKTVQREVNKKNSGDDVVPTTGLSTYGETSHTGADNHFTAKLDFRTGNATRPDDVRAIWNGVFTGVNSTIIIAEDLISEAQDQFAKGHFAFEIEGNKIIVKAKKAAPEHPSKFDLEDDQTVMPGLYLATWVAKINGMQVDAVRWNTKDRQNSNPLIGEIIINGNVGMTIDRLNEFVRNINSSAIEKLDEVGDAISEVRFILKEADGASTNEVLSPKDERLRRIVNAFSSGARIDKIMPYMTDIGRLFNALIGEDRRDLEHVPVYGFVKGQGNPDRLHKPDERVSIGEIDREIDEFPRLLKIIHDELLLST